MAHPQTESHKIRERTHSKAFEEGIGILAEEIQLALHWSRPSILLAIHKSSSSRIKAQKILEQQILKIGGRVTHVTVEGTNPDVILAMGQMQNSKSTIFFVSEIENANQVSNGKVYRALNLRRELLVENSICVVFWLDETEAANLPRLAPDFWSFRHRVVEFTSKSKNGMPTLSGGLFLWDEQIPWLEDTAKKNQLSYYEESLKQIPNEESAAATQIEMILKLTYYSWLLNDLKKIEHYLNEGFSLLEKYPIPHYQAWMLNAKGIILFEQKNKKDAHACFTQALSYNSENSAIMMNISIALLGLGKNTEAITTARRVIKKHPESFRLWHVLGYIFLFTGKNKDAINSLIKAHDLNPHNKDVHYSLAFFYYKDGQFAECTNALTKIEKDQPQNLIQQVYENILSGNHNEAHAKLKDAFECGEIRNEDILRDPNLSLLIDPQELMAPT